jgi:hypothetical protein
VKEQGNPPGRPGSLVRWVPVASWLPRYQRGWLTGDAITTTEQLGKLAADLRTRNVPLGLAHVHGPVLEMAERSGLLATVGADHVFPATPAAVAWARSVADGPASGLASTADPG